MIVTYKSLNEREVLDGTLVQRARLRLVMAPALMHRFEANRAQLRDEFQCLYLDWLRLARFVSEPAAHDAGFDSTADVERTIADFNADYEIKLLCTGAPAVPAELLLNWLTTVARLEGLIDARKPQQPSNLIFGTGYIA